MTKLKPCPFCGGKAKQHLSVLSWVECEKCGAKTPQYQFDNQSIDAWNNRASGWIPVSERLPEWLHEVLVQWENGEVYIDYVDSGGEWTFGGCYGRTIAWQPLPEAYIEV